MMEIIYQAQFLRHSRYGAPYGFMSWDKVHMGYFLMRKTKRRIVVKQDGATWYIYPKPNQYTWEQYIASQTEVGTITGLS